MIKAVTYCSLAGLLVALSALAFFASSFFCNAQKPNYLISQYASNLPTNWAYGSIVFDHETNQSFVTSGSQITRIYPNGTATNFGPGSSSCMGCSGLFIHPVNHLMYVVMYEEHCVRRFNVTTGEFVDVYAGACIRSWGGENKDGNLLSARFSHPSDIVYDSVLGRIFITDSGSNTIRMIDEKKAIVTTIAGDPQNDGKRDGGGTYAQFNSPRRLTLVPRQVTKFANITVAANGLNLLVSDYENHCIRWINSTFYVKTVAGSCGDSGRKDGTTLNARFKNLLSLKVDPAGYIFISESDGNGKGGVIRMISADGEVSSIVGVDGTPTADLLTDPDGLSTDTQGNLLIFDYLNRNVQKLECIVFDPPYYRDADGDGLGDPNSEFHLCFYQDPAKGFLQIPGYSLNADDCDDTNPRDSCNNKKSKGGLIAGLVILFLLLAALILGTPGAGIGLAIFCRKRKNKKQGAGTNAHKTASELESQRSKGSNTTSSLVSISSEGGGGGGPAKANLDIFISSSSWEISPSAVQIVSKLGAGAFGVVYKAEYDGEFVALKRFNVGDEGDQNSKEIIEDFQNEVKVMAMLRHPHVVSFVGTLLELPHIAILTEYMDSGTLYDVIHKNKPNNRRHLGWKAKVKYLHEVALGEQYLHKMNLIHRDLKSQNVLMTTRSSSSSGSGGALLHAKVADFGLAKLRNSINSTNTQAVGTALWMAPEVAAGEKYDNKCDVYSFGMLAVELLNERLPYHHIDLKHNIHMKVAFDPTFRPVFEPVFGDTEEVTQPHKFKQSHNKMIELIKKCWQHDPAARPSFSDIVKELAAIQQLADSNN